MKTEIALLLCGFGMIALAAVIESYLPKKRKIKNLLGFGGVLLLLISAFISVIQE